MFRMAYVCGFRRGRNRRPGNPVATVMNMRETPEETPGICGRTAFPSRDEAGDGRAVIIQ